MKKQFIRQWALILLFALAMMPAALAQKTNLERVHENIRVTPYPQQDNPLYLNPSPLIVPTEMRKAEYLQFQLSQDQTFPKGKTIQSKPLAWCMFNPHRILENGTWYWRFRSINKDQKATEWSETYNFSVTEDIPQFVTPTFDVFMKNMPKSYPRIYCFIDKGLNKGQSTVTTHLEYKEMKRRADGAMKNSHETNPQPYKLIGKIATDFNYLYTAYRSTGEKQYADKMLAVTRALLAVPHDEKLRNDFVCGDILYIFTHIYDACYNQLTDAERKELEKRTFTTAKYHHMLQHKGGIENHIFDNHYWQRAFREMLQLGLMFGDTRDDAKEILEYCYELWTARAPASGFNRDGEWHNGQGYFNANTKTLWYVPALMSYVTGTDFLQHPFYKNLGKALVYAFPPRTKSAGFGDGNETSNIPPRQRVALADYIARETGDPYAVWYCNETKAARGDFDTRLQRMASQKSFPVDAPLPEDAPKALWMKDTGEMLAHSNLKRYRENLFLSFRSSPFGSGSHTLADQNSFNLHFRGVPVYRSTGYYLNFSDPHNLLSYRHTRAHNTILVDGIGQPFTTRAYGKIVRMLSGENIAYACGDASNAYCGLTDYPMWQKNFKNSKVEESVANGFGETPLKKYRRHILLLHPNIVVIYDELEADKPVRWDWLLHSPVQFKLDENGKDKTLTTYYPEKKFTSTAYMFSNSDCTLSQTDKFFSAPDPKKMRKGRSYPNQWHMTAAYEKSTANRILTVILLLPDGSKPYTVIHDKNGTPNDFILAGKWKLRAQLDPKQPAELLIRDPKSGVLFSLGNKNLRIEGEDYKRTPGTSVLFDEMDGKWTIHEMSDIEPRPTGKVTK